MSSPILYVKFAASKKTFLCPQPQNIEEFFNQLKQEDTKNPPSLQIPIQRVRASELVLPTYLINSADSADSLLQISKQDDRAYFALPNTDTLKFEGDRAKSFSITQIGVPSCENSLLLTILRI
jgi:hypothetical protein